ncbi:MAG: hypothetical protein R2729_31010 [Bryobacteraceae bacterium]
MTPPLRARARETGKSLNEIAIEALRDGSGATGKLEQRRDLSEIAGTWKREKAVDDALADQDRVDESLRR